MGLKKWFFNRVFGGSRPQVKMKKCTSIKCLRRQRSHTWDAKIKGWVCDHCEKIN